MLVFLVEGGVTGNPKLAHPSTFIYDFLVKIKQWKYIFAIRVASLVHRKFIYERETAC